MIIPFRRLRLVQNPQEFTSCEQTAEVNGTLIAHRTKTLKLRSDAPFPSEVLQSHATTRENLDGTGRHRPSGNDNDFDLLGA